MLTLSRKPGTRGTSTIIVQHVESGDTIEVVLVSTNKAKISAKIGFRGDEKKFKVTRPPKTKKKEVQE